MLLNAINLQKNRVKRGFIKEFSITRVLRTRFKMMSMGMAAAGNPAASSSAAFWQQARQLPHMNTFNMNNSMATSSAMVSAGATGASMGHMGHHHGASHVNPTPPHDAKMAEKIVSELQVTSKMEQIWEHPLTSLTSIGREGLLKSNVNDTS